MRTKTQVTAVCQYCSKDFKTHAYRIKNGTGKFCGMDCYLASRWGKEQPCKQCGKPSRYRFCDDDCRKKFWDKNSYSVYRHPSNWKRKTELIESLGGKCVTCGETDFRVLDIDHIDRSTKLKERNESPNWRNRFKDWEANKGNLRLLCANCHRRHTWEQMGYGVHNKTD